MMTHPTTIQELDKSRGAAAWHRLSRLSRDTCWSVSNVVRTHDESLCPGITDITLALIAHPRLREAVQAVLRGEATVCPSDATPRMLREANHSMWVDKKYKAILAASPWADWKQAKNTGGHHENLGED